MITAPKAWEDGALPEIPDDEPEPEVEVEPDPAVTEKPAAPPRTSRKAQE
ncbi:hypothetical protein [Streptomyces sp. NPDC058877]